MRSLIAWLILIVVFFTAGSGLNLFRIHIEDWLAYGRVGDIVLCFIGLVVTSVATAFLGGFVYYRDKKRGKLKRPKTRHRTAKNSQS